MYLAKYGLGIYFGVVGVFCCCCFPLPPKLLSSD